MTNPKEILDLGGDLFDSEYEPSPVPRVRDQVALYEATGGTDGNTLEGRRVVILTSIGAKSAKVRKNPIMRVEDDGIYVAVASAGGAPKNPSWYGNLIAHPDVLVQDGSNVLHLRAREVFGQEKQRWWLVAERFWPHYPEYRQAAGREIPMLLLEPPTMDHPITIDTDTVRVVARVADVVIADSSAALTLRESGYAPVYYLPLTSVGPNILRTSSTETYCPYKGDASYYDIVLPNGETLPDAVWTYRTPYPAVKQIAGHVAFYTDRVQIEAEQR
jgi:deazaflavin-dependent oxidoreductase (nitroreductase family)